MVNADSRLVVREADEAIWDGDAIVLEEETYENGDTCLTLFATCGRHEDSIANAYLIAEVHAMRDFVQFVSTNTAVPFWISGRAKEIQKSMRRKTRQIP